jgi:MoaA/NifB/PqqE/SkfB family radical SAM enzyme
MLARNGDSKPIHTLNKLYVEITGRCNLKCRMCMLTALDSPLGIMSLDAFRSLLQQLQAFAPMPAVHFAGYGEPTSHRHFLEIIQMAKATGAAVGITTNGTLLTPEMCTALVEMEVDRLVVSIDGTQPEHYQDIRLGAMLPAVLENLMNLRRIKIRLKGRLGKPQVGIAFVAMQRNFEDLLQLPALARRVDATEVIVSNVIPFTPEMESEILYEQSLTIINKYRSRQRAEISLPKMDVTPQMLAQFHALYTSAATVSLLDASLGARDSYCRFIEEGNAVIRWDGVVSPCLALVHEHDEYIKGRRHHIRHYGLGSIHETPLVEIWNQPEYQRFRERVHNFEFSPCSSCARCDYFESNQEDCMEKQASPVCGGCLWARGLVQCP